MIEGIKDNIKERDKELSGEELDEAVVNYFLDPDHPERRQKLGDQYQQLVNGLKALGRHEEFKFLEEDELKEED